MEKVYPRLKIHCQKAGFEFQVVDMRWGIKDASTDDHSVVDICMKQIEQSRHVSVGPYFVVRFRSLDLVTLYFMKPVEMD